MERCGAWQSASAAPRVGCLWGWVMEQITALFLFSLVFAEGDRSHWVPDDGDLGVMTKPELKKQNAFS